MLLTHAHTPALFAILAAASLAATATGVRAAAAPADYFGVCEHVTRSTAVPGGEFENMDAVMARARAAGFAWVRADFEWASCEPTEGAWNWDAFDAVFNAAETYGLKILPILNYDSAYSGLPACQDLTRWKRYVRRFIHRYGARLEAVEVWNEPDQNFAWHNAPNAAEYAALLKATYPVIKDEAPNLTVLSGGLAGDCSPFLESLYANGIKDYCDAVAIHPYCLPNAPDAVWKQSGGTVVRYLQGYIDAARAVMAAHGDSAKPLWITELGWTSAATVGVSEAEQASYLVRAMDIARAAGVARFFLYECKEPGNIADDGESHFGILTDTFARKPAYDAVRSSIWSAVADGADPYASHVWLERGDTDLNGCSFASATHWSDGAAPHADADYLVDLGFEELWIAGDNPVFAGRSLTIGRPGAGSGQVRQSHWWSIPTVTNLALNGGTWIAAAGDARESGAGVVGTAAVASPASAPFRFASDSGARAFTFGSALRGATGTAYLATALNDSSLLFYAVGDASAYAGAVLLEGFGATARFSAAALAGPAGAGAISMSAGAALAPLEDGQLFATARTLSSADGSARINVPAGQTMTLSCPLSGVFRKTGAGTLVIDGGTMGSGRIIVGEGDVEVDVDTAQFISAIDGGRVVYCVPAGSLASAQSIAAVTVPGPLSPGDVVLSDGAAANGWAASVVFEEDPAAPGTFTACVEVTATPRTAMGMDSFEAYDAGTAAAALPGWAGSGAVVAATPATAAGWPLPGETHERVLSLAGDATRTYADAFARDDQTLDMLVQVRRQPSDDDWQAAFADDGTLQLRLSFDADGHPVLLHADETGAPVWTRLSGAGRMADGAWVRVSFALAYASSTGGAAFAQVRIDGTLCTAATGRRSPSTAASPAGGSWHRLLSPAATAKVASVEFCGALGVDDLVHSYHDASLRPDFAPFPLDLNTTLFFVR